MPGSPDGSKRILVVDDNRSAVKAMELILKHQGFSVLGAYDGLDGLYLARSEKPDLIIMDVVMPEMDGYTVCRHLQEDPETASIPVILLTVKGQVNDIPDTPERQKILKQRLRERIQGFESGAVEFLSKPISAKEVAGVVKRTLGLTNLE
jgi:CheY-like chemotaxis protein